MSRWSDNDRNFGHFWTEPKGSKWDAYHAAKEACPRAIFDFEDFDGQKLTATTIIEEREWHFGTGWFKSRFDGRNKICEKIF